MKYQTFLRFCWSCMFVGLCLFSPAIAAMCPDGDGTNNLNNTDGPTTCSTGSETSIDSGDLTVDHTLAGYRSLGQPRALRLIYSSLKADPQPLVSVIVLVAKDPNLQSVSSRLEVLDVFSGNEIFTDLSGFGDDPSLAETEPIRQSLQFDASQIETGVYPYKMTTVFEAPGSVLDGSTLIRRGSVLVNNQQSSPFGAGWTLEGAASLVNIPLKILDDQRIFEGVLLVEGDGSTKLFEKLENGTFSSPVGDFSSLVRNPDDSYTRTDKDGTVSHFDAKGRQTDSIDRNGNAIKYGYSQDGLLTSVTDPVGRVTTLTYVNGLLVSIVDPADHKTIFTHQGRDLVGITDPDGSHRMFAYDSRHRMTSETSKRGFTTLHEYNFAGRNSRVVRPDGSVNVITPSQTQGVADLSMGQGTRDNPAPALLTKDVKARLSDAKGNVTRFETDIFGSATLVVDALGRKTVTATNDDGLPTRIERANGSVTEFEYDERGNPLKRIELSTGAITTFVYEPKFNQVTQTTDPNGNLTRFEYDEQGNLVETIDAKGQHRSLRYDGRGLVTHSTDPLGNTTTFEYDSLGNLVKTTDPLGNITSLAYDKAGNIKSSTNAKGDTTSFTYDSMNRLDDVKEPMGGITDYNYDENGNLIQIADANGHITEFHYDAMARRTVTIDPTGNKESVQYDGNGNIRSIINRKGETIAFEYDAISRLVKKTLPGQQTTAFLYDPVGNLTNVDDSDSRLILSYDGENRLISASTEGSPVQPQVTIGYAYDGKGNRLTMTDSLTGVTHYEYDTLDRVEAITDPAGQATRFAYDERGLLTGIERPNLVTTASVYDAANRLTKRVHRRNGDILSRFRYRYDPVGNRIALNTTRTGVAVKSSLRYAYDPLNRLTRAIRPLRGQPAERFVYDDVGNRLQRDGQAQLAVFDDANRLLEDQNFIYEYDANGNLIEKTGKATSAVTVYTYDAENKLVRLDLPDGKVATYRYDGLGRRIEKNVGGAVTRYVYDREDILFEFDGANTLSARYTHGLAVDEPLIMERDLDRSGSFELRERFFYQGDALGSITELTGASGKVAQSYVYDSFGQLVRQVGSVPNPYTYTGREFDAESGLYYYRARYYDPGIGRFIQEDPFRGVLTLPPTLNLYAYVGNNSINFIDPTGRWWRWFLRLAIRIVLEICTNEQPIQIEQPTPPPVTEPASPPPDASPPP